MISKISEFLRANDSAGLAAYLGIKPTYAANCVHRFDLAGKVGNYTAQFRLLKHLNFLREFSPGNSAGETQNQNES